MTVIILDDSQKKYSKILNEEILKFGDKVVVFKANELNIKPCLACGSCSGKTFGKCVIEDDMQKILSEIVKSKKVIFISPVIYGGVSFHIKKILDRISSIGDPRYFVKYGELVKNMRVKDLEYYLIGIKNNINEKGTSIFIELHKENVKIMGVLGRALVIEGKSLKKVIGMALGDVVYE